MVKTPGYDLAKVRKKPSIGVLDLRFTSRFEARKLFDPGKGSKRKGFINRYLGVLVRSVSLYHGYSDLNKWLGYRIINDE